MESAFFDESVGTYIDSMGSRNFAARQRAFRAAAQLALERAGSDPVGVDVGVGTGYLTRTVASLGFRVIGCDSSPEMLKVAAESEREGPIVQNIANQLLQPTEFSPMK